MVIAVDIDAIRILWVIRYPKITNADDLTVHKKRTKRGELLLPKSWVLFQ